MRKLKLQMQLSVDGYISGPGGEMDWMVWSWDNELKNYVNGITRSVDQILLGRKLAEEFIPHWAAKAADKDEPNADFARKIASTPKIVFSKTLDTFDDETTTLISDANPYLINQIKNQQGNDIIVYGGGSFVSGLIEQGLIDEYHLFMNPVVLGKGRPIFNSMEEQLKLQLIRAKPFACGIVVLAYRYIAGTQLR